MIQAILRRCRRCGRYTLHKDKCPYCGGEVENPHPPKYSPDDRYYYYRLCMKVIAGVIPLPEDIRVKVIEKCYSGSLLPETQQQVSQEQTQQAQTTGQSSTSTSS